MAVPGGSGCVFPELGYNGASFETGPRPLTDATLL